MVKNRGARPAEEIRRVAGFLLALGLSVVPCVGQRVEAPLIFPMLSHAEWWQSQYGRSPAEWPAALNPQHANRDSGPACVAMLLNYKKKADIPADYGSFKDARFPNVHSYARWLFCRGNGDKGYPGGLADDDQVEATAKELADILENEDIPVILSEGPDEVTIEKIAEALRQKCPVLCRVDPPAYFPDEAKGSGRWVVVYGLDDKSVDIQDPGRPEGKCLAVPRSIFLSALRRPDGGRDPAMIQCLTLVGNYNDAWHADGTSRVFVEGFREFRKSLGVPVDRGGSADVHSVGSCIVQDFERPTGGPPGSQAGRSILFFNRSRMKAFPLGGVFYEKYFKIWAFDSLGTPTTNEYASKEGRRQDFEKGSLVWDGKSVLVITAGAAENNLKKK